MPLYSIKRYIETFLDFLSHLHCSIPQVSSYNMYFSMFSSSLLLDNMHFFCFSALLLNMK
ncbi:hypothetical protein Hanom_Chr01g00089101 [Helianthus anomalus]